MSQLCERAKSRPVWVKRVRSFFALHQTHYLVAKATGGAQQAFHTLVNAHASPGFLTDHYWNTQCHRFQYDQSKGVGPRGEHERVHACEGGEQIVAGEEAGKLGTPQMLAKPRRFTPIADDQGRGLLPARYSRLFAFVADGTQLKLDPAL